MSTPTKTFTNDIYTDLSNSLHIDQNLSVDKEDDAKVMYSKQLRHRSTDLSEKRKILSLSINQNLYPAPTSSPSTNLFLGGIYINILRYFFLFLQFCKL